MAQRIENLANHISAAATRTGALLASHGSTAAGQLRNVAAEHPVAATVVGAGAAVVAAPVLLSAPALAVAGYGSSGVVAGSLAATIQSSVGSVAAGSAFATLQSAGAAGAGLATVNGIAQGVGAGTAAVAWLMGYLGHDNNNNGNEKEAGGVETASIEEGEDQTEAQDLHHPSSDS
ncbi:Interferon-induced 6-16 [Metarhizium album ARSEF 1941]|uniref:Interferon-induced 6-16 n=1 Tax=Metarhizium album (strain ARSEF 1941) TaxID=1081103 RepID=A0A0B2X2R9_METAS|nr:Interferon-induced 6-16 [Metarhizium album ARSEF 1941]KHN99575.1 Interferon-induced 6-16 [Metarhizium album ARSEF 1941]